MAQLARFDQNVYDDSSPKGLVQQFEEDLFNGGQETLDIYSKWLEARWGPSNYNYRLQFNREISVGRSIRDRVQTKLNAFKHEFQ